jgi:hypothetical protein
MEAWNNLACRWKQSEGGEVVTAALRARSPLGEGIIVDLCSMRSLEAQERGWNPSSVT